MSNLNTSVQPVTLEAILGYFDGAGNLIQLYGPNGQPLNVSALLNVTTLPTSLPATAGVLWNNGGVLSVS